MSADPIKILLIDDDPGDARCLREALAEAGPGRFDLTRAPSPATGLAMLGGGFDLLLMDLSPPDGPGLETFRAARGHAPRMPIVALSGLDDETLASTLLREGGQDFLVKGRVDGRQLARAVRHAIARARAEAEVRPARDEREASLRLRIEALDRASDALHEEAGARRRAEAELRLARERAEAAARTKDRFLAVLSHELRTPLTPVLIAVTALLEDEGALDLRATLEMIGRNVQLEIRRIDDLLDLSQLTRGRLPLKREMVDTHALIRSAADARRGEARAAGLELGIDLAATAPYVAADPARLNQLVEGLVHNAIKFSPAGQAVRVRTRDRPPAPGDAGAGRLVVEVIDTGVGIEAEVLGRIFDPFEQAESAARRRSDGLGLGLTLARAVAEAHGGTLTASSAGPGRGSTFTLELTPLLGPRASLGEPRPAAGRPAEGRKILLVEDNQDTLRYLALLLNHRGHRVHPAPTVAAARSLAAAEEFDLILSDIELPDGTGLDLLRELNARRPTPAIAMSGFGSDCDIRLSRDAGFADHLVKPVDARALETVIRRVTAPGDGSGSWSGS